MPRLRLLLKESYKCYVNPTRTICVRGCLPSAALIRIERDHRGVIFQHVSSNQIRHYLVRMRQPSSGVIMPVHDFVVSPCSSSALGYAILVYEGFLPQSGERAFCRRGALEVSQ